MCKNEVTINNSLSSQVCRSSCDDLQSMFVGPDVIEIEKMERKKKHTQRNADTEILCMAY